MTTRRTAPDRSPAKPKFEYRSRTADDLKRRAQQGGTAREGFVNQDVKFFAPKPGDNRIRVLPPTWENPDHFGYEVFVHYGIGSDNSAYLCEDKMNRTAGDCPICAERGRAEAAGEKEYADSLRPSKRVCVYVVDRDRPSEGVLLWSMPWTIDRDVCARAVDKMSGEVYNVDDPESGYDILFNKEGQGQTTKYVGIDIARRSSPLSDDPAQSQAWLDYVLAHPIPSQLLHHDPEHVAAVFSGHAAAPAAEEPAPARTPIGRQAEAAQHKAEAKAKPLNEDAVMGMTEEELLAVIDDKGLEAALGDAFNGDLPDLKRAVCDLLWPVEAKTPQQPAKKETLKEKLARLRGEPA